MAKLEVEIGAKVDELKKALRDSQKKVSDFTAKVKKQTSELAKNNTQLAKTEKQLEKLNADYKKGAIDVTTYSKSVNTLEATQKNLSTNSAKLVSDLQKTNTSVKSLANQSMPQLGKSTANAVPAVTELSRVIQDAPFGIQGVGNNIQQLTAVFGNLVTKTGGTTSALKAMLGALSGPAGILFAVSAVTSLLTVFGTKLFKTKKNLEDAEKGSEDFVSGIKSLERSLADLFLTQDNINEKIEDYIILQKLKANADSKEKKSIERLKKVNKDLTEQRNKLASAERLLATNKVFLSREQNKETTNAKGFVKAIKRETEARTEALQKISELEKEKRDIILKSLEVLKEYREQRKKLNASLEGSVAALETQKKLLENEQRQVSTTSKTWKEYADRIQEVQDKIDRITKGSRPQAQTLDTNLQATGLQNIDLSIPEAVLQRPITQINELQLRMMQALMNFNAQMDNIIRNNIANTFAGIGQAIGNALASGANLGDELGKVLLSAIGSVLTQLGQLAITIGVTLLKIEASLKNLKGGIAIAAGVAAIALGSVFKSGAAKIGGNFSGGVGGGGSTGARSFTGGGFTGAQPFSGNLTFTIRGNDLVAVLNNAIDQTAIFGGNVTVSNG